MKKALIIVLLARVCNLSGQIDCGINRPPGNQEPDTVSTYVFLTGTIPAKKLPAVKATSNYSFKSGSFCLIWMPVCQKDINAFMAKSLGNINKNEIIDTVNCNLLNRDYIAIVTKSKRKRLVFYYLNSPGDQDIFIAMIRNKKQLKKAMEYIETNI